jgi:hypothetical protein
MSGSPRVPRFGSPRGAQLRLGRGVEPRPRELVDPRGPRRPPARGRDHRAGDHAVPGPGRLRMICPAARVPRSRGPGPLDAERQHAAGEPRGGIVRAYGFLQIGGPEQEAFLDVPVPEPGPVSSSSGAARPG